MTYNGVRDGEARHFYIRDYRHKIASKTEKTAKSQQSAKVNSLWANSIDDYI
jgi:hypothetical protein